MFSELFVVIIFRMRISVEIATHSLIQSMEAIKLYIKIFSISLQYLNGCNKYFATDVTDQMIESDVKSESHKATGPLKDDSLDDYQYFQRLDQAMSGMGLLETEKLKIYEVIAGVLHLGNVSFEEDGEGCKITDSSLESFEIASNLLHIDAPELRKSLTSKLLIVADTTIS